MRTCYGSYRALEQEFLTYITALQAGPQRPVLVLCPSGRLAEYLRRRLTAQNGFISNLFFVTFSQLMETVDAQHAASQIPLLPGDHFHDYLLKNILLNRGLDRYPLSRGFLSALKSSLMDMADSLADADVLEEHIETVTDPVLAADREHWQWLVQVYRAYQEQLNHVPEYRSYQQYFDQVLAQLSHSDWLRSFHEIVVYGFYELTGRQLELFRALQACYPMSVFWVYAPQPAFAFSRRFFEANLSGLAADKQPLQTPVTQLAAAQVLSDLFTTQSGSALPSGITWVSAPNPQGELFFVAKEIIRLHEEEKIDFADMAVTARTIEPYQYAIAPLFAQHAIALQADFPFPFKNQPLGIFVLNLFSLLRGGFERQDVLAVLNSPYFKIKNQWRYIIEASLVKRDYNQWIDLITPSVPDYDPGLLAWIEQVKDQLESLEEPTDWHLLWQTARQFLQTYTDTTVFSKTEQHLWQQIQDILAGFERYQTSSKQARLGEFMDELLNALQNGQYHQIYSAAQGVTVANVSSLRGMGFKVVFLLGMNEKMFPQIIREDPILKDYYRRILRDQLGFWINQKMERFEEERLLFFGALESATQHVYLSFLRADTEGKALIPSHYLAEVARAAGQDLHTVPIRRVAANLMERLKQIKPVYFTNQEASLWLAAQGAEETQYQQAGYTQSEVADVLAAARDIASLGALNSRDGLIKSGSRIFQAQHEKGFSPSALQKLAHCPMKYFFEKGLGLREQEDSRSRSELTSKARGTAYHEILMDYYRHLYQEGLTGQLFDTSLRQRANESLQRHYTAASYKRFGIYPVVWELILQDMRENLEEFVVQDARHLQGYIPQIFETSFEQFYHPSPELTIKLKGTIDRIDIDAAHQTFRVLDYKSNRQGKKELAEEMFKQVILQPFIYLILAQGQPQMKALHPDGAALLTIQKGYFRQELSQADFETIQPRADQFFSFLMQLISQGTFFMHPGAHCAFCPYADICRKDVFSSLLRVRHDKTAQLLKEATQ